ncbi:imidazole glycerol phosphate synthase subunit HisH [Xenorhabdus nematophila]|uniref:Imidazole glycerol phosphate synthase subunit HisH n=1 Tax=Xenorhabdus nematophila (strain ATCC 19061 / DSM 3370 / CCUG 14189 / LMG 1036 / NCIMB 9965 / AN6) TaxID=406817 RepID=D3VBE0_XENNA|nr:imidazole glycerol phosphate synthase subunit HisH [Xenorhabdus nematophila]CEE94741.1 glutamine amidotransferase, subunit with HisF [Xenorhabdus nematophila str. Anatoliense]CEF33015.1 glutamine amidotransferase, subunit with HisF [Xenorhabdus nematophila str. Websteri]AYA40745.1 imidazole glycerol phosphate synthase subunit HisH [Xenorhabdus nematophila]KHD28473.1 imidazole glycerol phosphate synthase [Xenorhabdus nematophila]MBA0019487.1 imidazole glycerol phosphate synthase subunit HisH
MNVVILDTGCANLASVAYAIRRLGYEPIVSLNAETVRSADKLLLPGVGTAGAAMKQLEQCQLIPLIHSLSQPVLGICLGMQLFASVSQEGDNVPLLKLIDAPVEKMAAAGLPLPHMGWNQVKAQKGHPLFRHIAENTRFYFVHSYALPVGQYTIAQTEYGNTFSSAIAKNNFFGVQFHPERSGSAGAQLLKNFLEM